MRNIILCAFAAATLVVTGAIAQHDEHHPDAVAPPADKSAGMPMKGQMMGQMSGPMMGQMMGQMMPMMAAHTEAAKIADQLVAGFTAIENEKNTKARNEKLAEHGRLLKELQTNLKAQAQMMEHMHAMMMSGEAKNK